jgi:hypothetical protein
VVLDVLRSRTHLWGKAAVLTWPRHNPLAAHARLLILAALYLFLFASNAGVSQPPVGDALEYRQIAEAAPGLPLEPVGASYAGRFAIHYVVGLLAWGGLSLDAAYDVIWGALMLAIFAVVFALLRDLSVSNFTICASLFVLNPYALRPYILQNNLLEALVFIVGLGICLLGLRNRMLVAVLAGLCVAVLGRQTAILVAPVAALWMLFDPKWRTSRSPQWAWAIVSVLLPCALLAGVTMFAAQFSSHLQPSVLRNLVFKRIPDLPGAGAELSAHFARTAAPLIVPIAAAIMLVLIVGFRQVTFACWACLLIAAAIAGQPAILDLSWPGMAFNEQRLAAMALLALVCAVAILLEQTNSRRPGFGVPILIAVVAVASLHHLYSSFGPRSLAQFVVLQLTAAAGVAWLLAVDRSKPSAPPETGKSAQSNSVTLDEQERSIASALSATGSGDQKS